MARYKAFFDDNLGRTVLLCNAQVEGETCLVEVDIDNVCPARDFHDNESLRHILDYTKEALHAEYWGLRTKGYGIIGTQELMVRKYGIPWDCIDLITHPRSN